MTKWKKEIAKKLRAQLTPLYEKICLPGHMADILIPAEDSCYEQYLYFSYQADVICDDIYGDAHTLQSNDYVSCYYVDESDDGSWKSYVEVATNLKQAINYLLQNYSINQLLSLRIGSIDSISCYG